MTAKEPTRHPLWRLRHNPMRRREDLVEGWVLLATWVVIAVGGPVAGVAGAHATADSLTRQRAERHPATAVLVREEQPGGSVRLGTTDDRVMGTVRWTTPDGTRHEDRTLVEPSLKSGDRIVVWVDPHNRVTVQPPTPAQTTTQAAATGVVASCAVTGAAAGGYYAVRAALDRRRARAWDTEWQKVGPQWGRTAR
ncbi:hypothetical protein ACH4UM_38750 [Streptomyces sp. NPDC020801]|uniref:Rv1733c family protein n=1 Tax=unclassified Streptomyces TaxID=2593676 RepID=UPI0037952599